MTEKISRRRMLQLGCSGLFLVATGGATSAMQACTVRSGANSDDSLFLAQLEEQVSDLTDNSPAVKWIAQRVAEMRKHLYVYKDFGSGENCFTQRLWMSEPDTPPAPAMNEDAASSSNGGNGEPGSADLAAADAATATDTTAAADAATATDTTATADATTVSSNSTEASSVKGIYAHLSFRDFPWGGYLFLNQTDTAQTPNAGVDITGAVELVLRARSASGNCRVEFFMGGYNNEWRSTVPEDLRDSADRCSTGSVTLTEEWQEFCIDLRGVNLSRIICGFGWAAYNRENSGLSELAFYVDDIYYRYPAPRNAPVFVESYVPLPSTVRGFELNSAAYTYDNAVACLALLAAKQDFCAQLIADALCFAMANDYLFSDGRLRNAYAAGDPHSYPGWTNDYGKEYTRLSGHWDIAHDRYVEDLYMSSSSTGVLAWVLLALCQAHEQCPRGDEYLFAAERLATLLLALKDDNGGFTAGFEVRNVGDGSEPNIDMYERVEYKSTEHNITLVAAFKMIARLLGETKGEPYLAASEHARTFVLSLFNADESYFNLGLSETGQIDGAILPLDVQTWGLLVLGDGFSERANVLKFIEEHLAVDGGFDFSVSTSNNKQRGIWTEGTAQALLCYLAVGDEQHTTQLKQTLARLSNADGSIDATDGKELFTGLYLAGTGAAWVYPPRRHLGATAWKAFAELQVNPFLSLVEQRKA